MFSLMNYDKYIYSHNQNPTVFIIPESSIFPS